MREYRCEGAEPGDRSNYDGAWKCVAANDEHAAQLFVEHLRDSGIITDGIRIRVMRIESSEFTTSLRVTRVNLEMERAVKACNEYKERHETNSAARVADIGRYG